MLHLRPAPLPLALALLILAFSSCGGAGDSASNPSHSSAGQPAQTGAPNLVFEDPILDFGEVWDVDDLVGEFPFQNTGDSLLVIDEIKPSCGCTTTKLDQMQYSPGEGSSIDVVWKPKGFGNQAKAITVHSNAPGEGLEMLTIRAKIKPFAAFTENPIRLGVLHEGQEFRKTVSLTCEDQQFELLELLSGNRYLSATDLGQQSDGSHKVELVFAADASWGLQTCSVQARVRGKLEGRSEPLEHTAVLQVSAAIFGELRVEPTMFAVGYVPFGRRFEAQVQLKSIDQRPFKVTSAEIQNPKPEGMTVAIEPFSVGINQGVKLKVSGVPGDYKGLIRGQVVFETDLPGEQQRRVPVMGIVR